MFENESFDNYIRSILGYPINNYRQMDNQVFFQGRVLDRNTELEESYPEIYKIIYPMVIKRCNEEQENITKEKIEEITDEIFSNIEVGENITLNINLQNKTPSNTTENRGNDVKVSEKVKNREDRQNLKNLYLRDLIKILVLREFLSNNRPGNRPPVRPTRPPFLPSEYLPNLTYFT